MDHADHIVFAPRAQQRVLREIRFAETIDLVFDRHPVYRQIAADAGLGRPGITSTDDLDRFPVTTKADYMATPEAYRLDTTGLGDDERALWDVMHTTGTTTGVPTPFYNTSYDFYRILSVQEGMMRLRGIGLDDSIANLFPLTVWPHGAYARVPHAAAAMKIPVISALPGNPSQNFAHGSNLDEVVTIVARSGATILWGVPSYVRRVLIRAGELGADFSSVRYVFVTGENTPEAMRTDFETRLAALGAPDVFVSISYGATEMQGGMVECAPGSGFHNPAPDQFLIEIVDPDTHRRVPAGQPGLVLLSHMDRRGTVLLRYALGDISALATGPCPHCGSETDRLAVTPARADSLLKIKGTLVNPALIEDILIADRSISEYQIVVERENASDDLSPDRLRLRIAGPAPGALPGIADTIKSAIGITPVIDLDSAEAIYAAGDTLKSRRLIDRRK
ncbi:MAG: phenylacetate-CoA ligase [Paracoccaceae bacterium]|jgi:phenylacetate-CoA ligase